MIGQEAALKFLKKIYNGLKFYTNGSTGYVDVSDVADILIQLLFF